MAPKPRPRHFLAAGAVLPLLVWWLGWYPGFASSDTIDQWAQAQSGLYHGNHPPIHTLYLGLLSLGGARPGLITLLQVLILGCLFVYAAHWLTRAGTPTWMAVAPMWLLALSPAVAPTTLAMWKDVVFGLFMLWAWIELLGIAANTSREANWPTMARLGIALSGIWLFRGNGPLTVLATIIVLTWALRRQLRSLGLVVACLAGVVVLTVGPLYGALDVQDSGIEPAQVFLPDLAASFMDEPETFSEEDIQLLEAVAPLDVWRDRYDCYDSTPLLFDPQFDHDPVRASPAAYLSLEIAVALRDFDTVLDHRLCVSNFVYWPDQPDDAYFHRPPYEIPDNELGLSRAPISDRAFAVTDGYWRWAEPDSLLWLTWRPAIVVLPALVAIVLFAIYRAGRRFLIPSSLLVAHLLNVMATTPAQEFRYAYPLYLMAIPTLALLPPTLRRFSRRRST